MNNKTLFSSAKQIVNVINSSKSHSGILLHKLKWNLPQEVETITNIRKNTFCFTFEEDGKIRGWETTKSFNSGEQGKSFTTQNFLQLGNAFKDAISPIKLFEKYAAVFKEKLVAQKEIISVQTVNKLDITKKNVQTK